MKFNLNTLCNIKDYFKYLGLENAIRIILNKKRDRIFKIHLKNKDVDIFLRGNSTDFIVFYSIFVRKEYDINITFEPEYILDCGANIGISTLFFRMKYSKAKIIAVEPEQSNYNMLIKNIDKYKDIIAVQGGVYYKKCKLKIDNKNSEKYAFQVIEGNDGNIDAYTIPSLLQKYKLPRIDILKIDIEGAELELFSNNLDWIYKTKCIIIELHDLIKPKSTKTFFKAIHKFDYTMGISAENIIIIFDKNEN